MTEYRVWCENGDLIDVYDNESDALTRVDRERAECPCDDTYCGVLYPHGISLQIVEA